MFKHVVWRLKDPSQRDAHDRCRTDPLHVAVKAIVDAHDAGRRAVDWEA